MADAALIITFKPKLWFRFIFRPIWFISTFIINWFDLKVRWNKELIQKLYKAVHTVKHNGKVISK